jgi:uncharacterized protein (DUF952 family)
MIRRACIQAALEGYERAAMDGLCHEGAWEAAISAIQQLDVAALSHDLDVIVHITSRKEWEAAQVAGLYRADSLASEGFIHCSRPSQVIRVANERFHGRPDLLLLVIDPERVTAELRFEDCYESGDLFPHIYGPLPQAAVVRVVDFPAEPDGCFTLPPLR